jgi:hypothetical protein
MGQCWYASQQAGASRKYRKFIFIFVLLLVSVLLFSESV